MILLYERNAADGDKPEMVSWMYKKLGIVLQAVDPTIRVRLRNPALVDYYYFISGAKFFCLKDLDSGIYMALYEITREEFETELKRHIGRMLLC